MEEPATAWKADRLIASTKSRRTKSISAVHLVSPTRMRHGGIEDRLMTGQNPFGSPLLSRRLHMIRKTTMTRHYDGNSHQEQTDLERKVSRDLSLVIRPKKASQLRGNTSESLLKSQFNFTESELPHPIGQFDYAMYDLKDRGREYRLYSWRMVRKLAKTDTCKVHGCGLALGSNRGSIVSRKASDETRRSIGRSKAFSTVMLKLSDIGGTMQSRGTMPGAGERSQKNGAAFGLIVAVSRDYSRMDKVAGASLMEFLARNRFCGRFRVYFNLTTEMNFYPIRKQRLCLDIQNSIHATFLPNNQSRCIFDGPDVSSSAISIALLMKIMTQFRNKPPRFSKTRFARRDFQLLKSALVAGKEESITSELCLKNVKSTRRNLSGRLASGRARIFETQTRFFKRMTDQHPNCELYPARLLGSTPPRNTHKEKISRQDYVLKTSDARCLLEKKP
ncbi:hypothetical protein EAG_15182 [Camponotus floridanus]|uniref:Uncharacterized protein n=1 Tax=Camponotus floridanus TaxID=104421 RepID=E2AYA0_CAMFO|nr:hypothetical protein EAG_15182 [Camponotus floridanus]